MYEEILVPTDGSEGAEAVLDHATWIAERAGARVHALFVVDDRGAAGEWDMVVEREEELGERAVEAVEAAARERGVPVEKRLRRGTPHEEIVDYAADSDVDLVVMGTHGRTGIDRVVHAGSVTERVVRYTDVPVLAAPLRDGE